MAETRSTSFHSCTAQVSNFPYKFKPKCVLEPSPYFAACVGKRDQGLYAATYPPALHIGMIGETIRHFSLRLRTPAQNEHINKNEKHSALSDDHMPPSYVAKFQYYWTKIQATSGSTLVRFEDRHFASSAFPQDLNPRNASVQSSPSRVKTNLFLRLSVKTTHLLQKCLHFTTRIQNFGQHAYPFVAKYASCWSKPTTSFKWMRSARLQTRTNCNSSRRQIKVDPLLYHIALLCLAFLLMRSGLQCNGCTHIALSKHFSNCSHTTFILHLKYSSFIGPLQPSPICNDAFLETFVFGKEQAQLFFKRQTDKRITSFTWIDFSPQGRASHYAEVYSISIFGYRI